jgi:hypothetical protein
MKSITTCPHCGAHGAWQPTLLAWANEDKYGPHPPVECIAGFLVCDAHKADAEKSILNGEFLEQVSQLLRKTGRAGVVRGEVRWERVKP